MLTPAIQESLTGALLRNASFANPAIWQSLHTGDPGSTGANEATSGSGAGGRQQASFSGSGGVDANAGQLTYTINGPLTLTWVGFWTAQTGGTFLGGFPLTGPALTAVGLSGSPTLRCPAHGLSVAQAVRCFAIPGIQSDVPAPLSPDVQFLVTAVPDVDSLQLIHAGGSLITMSSSGGFQLALDMSQVLVGASQVVFPASTGIVYSTVSG